MAFCKIDPWSWAAQPLIRFFWKTERPLWTASDLNLPSSSPVRLKDMGPAWMGVYVVPAKGLPWTSTAPTYWLILTSEIWRVLKMNRRLKWEYVYSPNYDVLPKTTFFFFVKNVERFTILRVILAQGLKA
jgi:hypothetical protein